MLFFVVVSVFGVAIVLVAGTVRAPWALAITALLLTFATLSLWFVVALGCGSENQSERHLARCAEPWPHLPLWGAGVLLSAVFVSWVTKKWTVTRMALLVSVALSVVSMIGLSS